MFEPSKDQFTIDDRSQLIYALTEASALEHVLMCQYLFAGASLKTHVSELRGNSRKYHQIEMIRYWKRKVFEIAREEMQHLAMATNLLVAVGGSPTFQRPNFPNVNLYYKEKLPDGTIRGLEMALEKFSGPESEPLRTIDRFVRFEQPHPHAAEIMAKRIPQPNIYDSVGTLYLAIREAIAQIPNAIIDVSDQYDPSDEDTAPIRTPNRPLFSTVVTTVAEAQALIDQIVDQGEGYPDVQDDPNAHYMIFKRIRDNYEKELQSDSQFDPARNVVLNPAVRTYEESGPPSLISQTIDDGFQYGLLQLFSGAYEILLGWLGQLFSRGGGPKPAALRAIETVTFLPFMSEVIAPLAELLTLVPVPLGNEEDKRLGASFEVTSNNFLIPSLDVGVALSFERIKDLANNANELVKQAASAKLDDVRRRLEFVAKTLDLLDSELQSRIQYGWPPAASSWDPKYSERAPDDFAFDLKKYALLNLRFEGVAQCRLATDPDGADVRRGVTGNGFAIGDEPDLDRVIRFQNDRAVPRSHRPRIGVIVKSASIKERSQLPWADRGRPVPELAGTIVDFVGDPRFEGRNHLVSEDGEPIDPFEVEVRAAGGAFFRRKVRGIPINDMTPVQRRGSGRYPQSVSLSEQAMLANLAVLGRHDPAFGFDTPIEYTQDRIVRLNRELSALDDTSDPTGRIRAELGFRLQCLDEGLRARMQLDARPIRWTRYFFDAQYRHLLSGPVKIVSGQLDKLFKILDGADSPSWLIEYNFGFFDTDAMSMVVRGQLYVQIRLK